MEITVDKVYVGGPDGNEDDFENEEGENYKTITIPAKYEVCPTCRGKGATSNYLGAFTQSRWDEMDEDWKEDYLKGNYDRHCEECNGQRVILVPDRENADPEALALYDQHQEDEAYIDGIQRQEMMMEMGAAYGTEMGWYD